MFLFGLILTMLMNCTKGFCLCVSFCFVFVFLFCVCYILCALFCLVSVVFCVSLCVSFLECKLATSGIKH
jgi:hypothetical protein